MKIFNGCLIAILAPVGLIWFIFFLRGLWIDQTLELRTTLTDRQLNTAESDPDTFEKKILYAFNFLAREDDYVTPDKRVTYKRRNIEQGDYDLNKDGFTSMIEMEKFQRRRWGVFNYSDSRSYSATSLMAFDTNNDNKVTRQEIEREIKTLTFQRCPFPDLSNDSKIVFLISGSGGQPSMVSVSGVAEITKVSNLHIAEDAPKMYIVATTENPTIWNISGNIDRIDQFVVHNKKGSNRAINALNFANVGVTGLPKGKITFLGKACLFHNKPYSYEPLTYGAERQTKMNARLKARIGRAADIIISEAQLNEVSIPNGYPLDTKAGDSKQRISTRRKISSTWDKSHFDVELERVISPKPPVRYQILPGKEGIKQLIKSGKIERLGNEGSAEVYFVSEELPHYPVGLVLHHYAFVFDKQTPQPAFNPGYTVRVR